MRMNSAAKATTGVKAPPTAMAIRTAKASTTTTPAPRANRVNVMRPVSRIHRTEAAHPALVLDHSLVEVPAPHVRPEDLGKDQLAVGDLPEQEVRDTGLTRRPDHQVRTGHVGVGDRAPHPLLAALPGGEPLAHQGPDGADDLAPPAIVEGQRQG